MIITIDGPAGAGKSTVARLLANRLGYRYLDTGALYRAITLKALRLKLKPSQTLQLQSMLRKSRITFREKTGTQRVLLDGEDITSLIRHPDLTERVFRYAELPVVRKAMLSLQRRLARGGKIVTEGRDLGSVVFPEADIKFYLDASLKERVRRRYQELRRLNRSIKISTVKEEIQKRDRRDHTRKLAPLTKPKDAIYVDTSHLSIKQVVNKLYQIVKRKEGNT